MGINWKQGVGVDGREHKKLRDPCKTVSHRWSNNHRNLIKRKEETKRVVPILLLE